MPSPPYASEMPIRASHRYISRLLKTDFRDDRRAPDPEALDHVCEVFAQLGGSWADLFLGSAEQVGLLRNVITAAISSDVLPRKPKWS
jgi:hypothetical protein